MNRYAFAPLSLAFCLTMGAGLTGCDREEPLTREEASEALTEVQISTEANALTGEMVTLTTDFTIGDAVESAAANLRDFVESQIPCATVSRAERTVTIDFGVMGECTWKGRSWSGQTAVTVERVDGEVQVSHVWRTLSDGFLTVDGSASVTWSFEQLSRRVVHEMSWTDGEHVASSRGDRMQSLLESRDGLRIDGERGWTGRKGGDWQLDIDGVEVRGLDPVPQAGTYTLENPAGKSLAMSFARVDARTIKVTVSGPRRDFEFDVVSLR